MIAIANGSIVRRRPIPLAGRVMDDISKLISRLEKEVCDAIDLPQAIAMLVRQAITQEVDPYVTLGVLVESIAHTLARAIA